MSAVVGTHRRLLYQANGFPPPTGTDAEPAEGKALSDYLGFRSETGPATFQWPPGP